MSNNKNTEHRKGTARIQFIYPDGKPAAGKSVSIKQTQHKFLFACGAFETTKVTHPANEEEREFYTERMNKWLQIFNCATLPFYWGRFEPEQGKPNTEQILAAANWLRGHGIVLKGHPLCWHTHTVPWINNIEPQAVLEAQIERIHRDVAAFKGIVDMWDVINEVVIMPVFDKEENGITKLCKDMGRIKLVSRMFAETRACNPNATLLINDFNTSQAYEILIEGCLEAGIAIDAIGIQSHQHQGYWGREKLERVLERFSRFGLPIHFTENTFVSGHLMPPEIVDLNDYRIPRWDTTPEGEARQASNVEEFYRILFEHPLVEAITTWAFQDGAWLGAPAGLVRTDNSTKPAYDTLRHLIKDEWNSNLTAATDKSGWVDFTGFLGQYEVSLGDEVLPLTLESSGEQVVHLGHKQ